MGERCRTRQRLRRLIRAERREALGPRSRRPGLRRQCELSTGPSTRRPTKSPRGAISRRSRVEQAPGRLARRVRPDHVGGRRADVDDPAWRARLRFADAARGAGRQREHVVEPRRPCVSGRARPLRLPRAPQWRRAKLTMSELGAGAARALPRARTARRALEDRDAGEANCALMPAARLGCGAATPRAFSPPMRPQPSLCSPARAIALPGFTSIARW